MELTENQTYEKSAEQCLLRTRSTLLPHEYEYTCISCGYNVIKRTKELTKKQRKKVNFINRLKDAEKNNSYMQKRIQKL